jgi:hypothetical protein
MDKKRVLIVACILILTSIIVPTTKALITETAPRPLPLPKFLLALSGPNILVKNIGDANATNVHVRRYLEGGLIMLGKDKTVSFSSIAVGETKEAKMGGIFGLGTTMITISISCDEGVNQSKSVYAHILFFFILL